MEFLTDWGVVIALVCAGCALIYGVVTSRWLLALSPGNQEMQDISMAVQDGAKAYLRRQYTIIAGVAVVLAILLAVGLEAQDANGILVAIGFLIGGTFSGAACGAGACPAALIPISRHRTTVIVTPKSVRFEPTFMLSPPARLDVR